MTDWLNGVLLHAARMDGTAARSRYATVTSYDADTHAVRVMLQPEGVQTGWLPLTAVSVGKGVGLVAGANVGDQVFVEPAEGSGDGWVVTGRFWSTQNPPPKSTATDKPIQSGEVALVTQGAVIHLVGDTVHIQAAHLKSKGHWEHEGLFEATEDVKAGSVSLKQHKHTEVQHGGGLSGIPQQ